MTFDRTITVISVAVAVIASLAATVQSYISWSGRNDTLNSAALGQVVSVCHDTACKVGTVSTIKNFSIEQMQDIQAQLGALDVVVAAIYPTEQQPMQSIFGEYARDALGADLNTTSDELRNIQTRFIVKLRSKCTETIQQQLKG
jgi:hypothetical protein